MIADIVGNHEIIDMNVAKEIKVWDIGVRLFHWLLVIAFIIAYVSGEDNEIVHANAGYIVSALIIFRVIWGFIGTKYARFSNFIYKPAAILQYLRDLKNKQPSHYLGHNPAGGIMVIVLLVSLFLSCWSGIIVYGQEGHGPLAGNDIQLISNAMADTDKNHDEDSDHEWMEEAHELLSNFTLLLVLLHIMGVLIGSKLHHENLIKVMITGRKPLNNKPNK